MTLPHLDDDVALPGAAAVQLPVLLHHDDLALLLHLVRVLLHMVEDAAVVLLGDAHELVHNNMRKSNEAIVEQEAGLNQTRITSAVIAPAHECDGSERTRGARGSLYFEESAALLY